MDIPVDSANEPAARGADSIIGTLEEARRLFVSLVETSGRIFTATARE